MRRRSARLVAFARVDLEAQRGRVTVDGPVQERDADEHWAFAAGPACAVFGLRVEVLYEWCEVPAVLGEALILCYAVFKLAERGQYRGYILIPIRKS